MTYKNAKDILPDELLQQLQEYASGELLYIPAAERSRENWGKRSGARDSYRRRNQQICELYRQQYSKEELAQRFFLSVDSIRKIVNQYRDEAGEIKI